MKILLNGNPIGFIKELPNNRGYYWHAFNRSGRVGKDLEECKKLAMKALGKKITFQ